MAFLHETVQSKNIDTIMLQMQTRDSVRFSGHYASVLPRTTGTRGLITLVNTTTSCSTIAKLPHCRDGVDLTVEIHLVEGRLIV